MNERLLAQYSEALRTTLGHEGRMLSLSKSGYRERHRNHVAIFNANICIAKGELWHGDIDLTLSETELATASEQIGRVLYVLYEYDGFDNEDAPLLDRAIYSITPSGHTRYQHKWIERDLNGTLRRRPSPPRPRWRWRVLAHRPRLLHFWVWEHQSRSYDLIERGRSHLLYVGKRDNGATPLLVLGIGRGERLRTLSFELTWYPADGFGRSAGRALLTLTPAVPQDWRLNLWANVIVWPGRVYSFQTAYQLRRRWQ